MIARTHATGQGGLAPAVLRFTTSLGPDLGLVEEDLLGSLAHLAMLGRQGIVPPDDAARLRQALIAIRNDWRGGRLAFADEEDIHMAIEAELTRRLGEVAGRLHTARSRNDQIALDLRLHVREQERLSLLAVAGMLGDLAARAREERATLLPAYTHRQRAQAISFAYLLCGYGAMFLRDIEALFFALDQVDSMPLGVGAIAGTGLPIDRDLVRLSLGFSRLTINGLDTVGDRDFALDFCFAAARCQIHCSRVATDVIDFASTEFGFLALDDSISCGSSLMPQKKNPDLFELVRGKTARPVANLMQLFTLLRGLPGGYNRDLQEDRTAVLSTGPTLIGVLDALRLGLSRVTVVRQRAQAAVEGDSLQAVDLAEALVAQGVPFRNAYQAVGQVVAACRAAGVPLAAATEAQLANAHPLLSSAALAALDPAAAVARKESPGGTGPRSVDRQIEQLLAGARAAVERARQVPSLESLAAELGEGARP